MLCIMFLCFDLSFASQTVGWCESLRDTYAEKTFLFVNAVVGLTWKEWGESEIALFVILSSLWKSPNSPSKHFDLQVRGGAAVKKGKKILRLSVITITHTKLKQHLNWGLKAKVDTVSSWTLVADVVSCHVMCTVSMWGIAGMLNLAFSSTHYCAYNIMLFFYEWHVQQLAQITCDWIHFWSNLMFYQNKDEKD